MTRDLRWLGLSGAAAAVLLAAAWAARGPSLQVQPGHEIVACELTHPFEGGGRIEASFYTQGQAVADGRTLYLDVDWEITGPTPVTVLLDRDRIGARVVLEPNTGWWGPSQRCAGPVDLEETFPVEIQVTNAPPRGLTFVFACGRHFETADGRAPFVFAPSEMAEGCSAYAVRWDDAVSPLVRMEPGRSSYTLALPGPDQAGLDAQIVGDLVMNVSPGSAAAGAGLYVGDQILKVDGAWYDAETDRSGASFWGPTGTPVRLTVARGDRIVEVDVPRGGLDRPWP